MEGKHDELPEQAFYMVGTIDKAVEKGRRLAGDDQQQAPEETSEEDVAAEREAEPAGVS
jgi:hypothetical protein